VRTTLLRLARVRPRHVRTQVALQRDFLKSLLADFTVRFVHEGTLPKWGTYLLWLRRRPVQRWVGTAGCLQRNARGSWTRYPRLGNTAEVSTVSSDASTSTSDGGRPGAPRPAVTKAVTRPTLCMGRTFIMTALTTPEMVDKFVRAQCWWEPAVIREAEQREEVTRLMAPEYRGAQRFV